MLTIKKLIKYSIVVLLLLLVACNSATPAPVDENESNNQETTSQAEIGPIRVGYLPVLPFAPFFVAYEKGYFTEQGLEVELEGFRGGPAMMTPLSTGQLDVGRGATGAAFFNAINQGLDIKMVAGGPVSETQSQAGMPLLVRNALVESGEVTSVADLAGRKIALNVKGGIAEYLIAKTLEIGGLTLEDVELVVLPIPETKVALENGAIDAVPVAYPLAGQFLQEQIASPIISPDEMEGTFQFGGLFYGQRFLDPANREVAVRFLAAYLKAEREIYQNPQIEDDEIAEIIHQYTNIPPLAIQNSPLPQPVDGRIETELLREIQDFFIERGYTEFTEPVPAEAMIDTSYLEAARTELDAPSQ